MEHCSRERAERVASDVEVAEFPEETDGDREVSESVALEGEALEVR